jgi:hypothetical protein
MAYGASMSNIVATRNLYTEHQNIAGTTEEDRRHFLEQEKKKQVMVEAGNKNNTYKDEHSSFNKNHSVHESSI